MANVLRELTQVLKEYDMEMSDVKCFEIVYDQQFGYDENAEIFTMYAYDTNHPKPALYDEHLEATIQDMNNCNYDEGYGAQKLFGTVWLKNGDWMTRGEYDGSEWWEYHTMPDIPKHLMLDKQGNNLSGLSI